MTRAHKRLADQLGALKAEMADLAARERLLKDKLIATGYDIVEGDTFRVADRRSRSAPRSISTRSAPC